ncbi:alpha/beta fold hydrolase [Sanguibacter suaedae]|uniref:Alpha/beta hydrolase n=1 Tax=Sanguibacter suaedae TaxID=2795737 RepID=A0A934I5J0_9MICO|nr:alpha/beta hydrolase [Sanguibacter suaedae]MBI9113582.1 alpha/beta hydrolase [Sanguibacter suaedae]
MLVQPAEPFGGLPLPDGVRCLSIRSTVGELTALCSPAATTRWGVAAEPRGTVLLVPGLGGSKEDFLPLMPLLSDLGWDTWSFSQRGQADSVAPRSSLSYRLDDFASDVVEVAHVISDGPVHLLGHSFGGLVARAAVLRSPDLFSDLTFLCSGPKCWTEEIREMALVVRESGSLGLWEASNPDLVGPGAPQLTPQEEFLRYRAGQTSSDGLLGIINVLVNAPDTTADLVRAGVRALVTHGAADDAWPQPWQELMARALGARYEIIPGAGHLPPEENPGDTAALLDDFWGETEELAAAAAAAAAAARPRNAVFAI